MIESTKATRLGLSIAQKSTGIVSARALVCKVGNFQNVREVVADCLEPSERILTVPYRLLNKSAQLTKSLNTD